MTSARRLFAPLLLVGQLLTGCGGSEVAAPEPAREDPLDLSGSLEPGEFPVVFRHEVLTLEVATVKSPTAARLYLWFPATSRSTIKSRPMTLADYYRVQEQEEPSDEELLVWLREDMTSPPDLDDKTLERVLASPMWAKSAGAAGEPAPGPHSLVLWGYRDSVPTMQPVLSEFLASHGYVVAFVWPVDNAPPLPWHEGLTEADKAAALGTQVELLERTLDDLLAREWIDDRRTTILAWSYGGESANLLQRRRDEIRLAIGMDSTLTRGWVFLPASELEAVDRNEFDVPYAQLQHGRPRLDGDVTPEPTLLAEIPAGAWFLRFPRLSHGNFNFPGGMLPGLLDLAEVSPWAVGGETARDGYEEVCRHVLGLLERHHRGERSPPESWSTAAPGFVEIRELPGEG